MYHQEGGGGLTPPKDAKGQKQHFVSRGPLVPLSHCKRTFLQRLGTSNDNNVLLKTQASLYTWKYNRHTYSAFTPNPHPMY